MRKTRVSVIIPVFNNEQSLAELTRRLVDHLDDNKLSFEIIMINDASEDHSMNVIQNLSYSYPDVKPIFLSENVGQHKAILRGLEVSQGEYIAVMDADLQDQPELIAEMCQLMIGNDEAVFIIRKGVYQSNTRMFTSFVMKSIVRMFTGLHHKAGSYFLMPRALLASVISLGQNCRHAYISIVVCSCATRLKYFEANRSKSNFQSGYTFAKRIRAAYKAIYCAIYCKLEQKKYQEKNSFAANTHFSN